ncbi:glycosyltransferase, partial [Gottfriedia acidiceleris]|uniref:glycosyltransferase n=1 Tax=Gottfriedia acidiceleris TaxID=371036 RepID=UPI002FFF0972
MKIMQIVTQMEGGGAQRVAVNLNNEMNKMGLNSNLCFLYLKRPTYSHVPNTSVLMENKITSIFGFIKLLFKLIKFIISFKPDVLVTHTHYSNVLVQPIAWILGVRRRIAVQHNPVETYPRVAIILDRLLGNFNIYTKNVVVSKTVLDSYEKYSKRYKDKLVLIYNGIEIEEKNEKSNNKYDFNFSNDEPIILNVGRLSLQKNQKIIIEAMQYIDYG